MRVCVVGAGIIGLSTAFQIKKLIPSVELTVIANSFHPNTTSDVAGGIWEPHLVTYPDEQVLNKWQETTFGYIRDLANKPNANEYGAFSCSVLNFLNGEMQTPAWSKIVHGFRILTPNEIRRFMGEDHGTGWSFSSYILEGSKYLPYLMTKLKRGDVKFEIRTINNLEELVDFDVVANCTGYGARKLVGDYNVVAYSGQVIKSDAMNQKFCITSDKHNAYVIPRSDGLIMGGTEIEGDEGRIPDEETTKLIYEKCCKMLPQLRGCKIKQVLKGTRPYRKNGIRVEKEIKKFESKQMKIVHNYGHGGNGVTLHWGCAITAAELVKELLQ